MAEEKKVAVLTEQGFVAGKFGYNELNEKDQQNVSESSKEEK